MVKNLGIRIKELRIAKGITQNELAQNIGVMQTTISKYESDTKIPSVEILIIIADYFDVTTDYLLGRAEW